MYVMRFTVIDPNGTVSFVAPCNGLKALVAACSSQPPPTTTRELLAATAGYDDRLGDNVLNGLARFDEYNSAEQHSNFDAAIQLFSADSRDHELPPFRVINEATRDLSLTPVKAGLVLFNLAQKRIIQVQNTYAEVERRDRGRIHRGGKPTQQLYHYQLPPDWAILP
ncbi:MAG: hypothetical protein DLM69_07800 [Candidatus Chloroheliales bacterium]|nr:MAG: hypothetical protein DLM69_07800 [Chloroflexota bacterium]